MPLPAAVLRSLRDFEETGEALALLAMQRALHAIGLAERDVLTTEALDASVPHYAGLVRQWLHLLAETGLCEQRGRFFVRRAPMADRLAVEQAFAGTLRNLTESLSWNERGGGVLGWIEDCVTRLPDLIRRDPSEAVALLFPEGDASRSEGLYERNALASHLGSTIADAVAALCVRAPEPLRILEVGAGIGGLTAPVLKRLDGFELGYLFTDVGPTSSRSPARSSAREPGCASASATSRSRRNRKSRRSTPSTWVSRPTSCTTRATRRRRSQTCAG